MNRQLETYKAGLLHADGLGGVQDVPTEQFGTSDIRVKVPGLDRAHAALKALVTEATGIAIPQRRQIVLMVGETTIATIEITDDTVWREFAHDLGFQS